MELEFRQESITYLQSVLHETVLQEECGETIVPDAMPDMERIVDAFAGVVLRGKECQGGNISLSGDIQAAVLYLAREEDTPRMLSVYLPFSLRRTVAGEDCRCVAECTVRGVDARMLNSRKLSVRVNLCIRLDVLEPQEELCLRPGKYERFVQLKTAEYPMQLPVECGEKSMLLRETLPLGAGQPEAVRLLHSNARCEITDAKLTGSKAVCKGNLQLSVLYETPEGLLNSVELPLPFSHFMELNGEYEAQGLRLTPLLTALEAVAEGESISVEASVSMQCCVIQTVPVPLVADAYATKGALELRWREYGMRPQLDSRLHRQELRQAFPANCAQVVRAEALPDTVQLEWHDGICRIRVPVQLRVLYRDKEGCYQSLSQREELVDEVNAADRLCDARAWVDGTVFAAPGAGGIELRVPIAVRCDWYGNAELRAVCGGTLEEEPPREEQPAVIIRTLEEDMPLWNIAKELRTTVSAIQIANDMQLDSAPAGTMLLIPIVA